MSGMKFLLDALHFEVQKVEYFGRSLVPEFLVVFVVNNHGRSFQVLGHDSIGVVVPLHVFVNFSVARNGLHEFDDIVRDGHMRFFVRCRW